MTIDEYIAKIKEFVVVRNEDLEAYLITLLASEAGEVAGEYGKVLRGDYHLSDTHFLYYDEARYRDKIIKELGDCAFALFLLSDFYGFTLEQVMQANIDKLAARKEKGTIMGEGSDR